MTGIYAPQEISDASDRVQSSVFVPRSDLGRRLLSLRELARAKGMSVLSVNEVLNEIKIIRGEKNNAPADVP